MKNSQRSKIICNKSSTNLLLRMCTHMETKPDILVSPNISKCAWIFSEPVHWNQKSQKELTQIMNFYTCVLICLAAFKFLEMYIVQLSMHELRWVNSQVHLFVNDNWTRTRSVNMLLSKRVLPENKPNFYNQNRPLCYIP